MLKLRLFIIILTVFIYAKNVRSLHCYVSDFESIKLGNVKRLNHTLQDCSNYNDEVKLVNHQLQIPENETLHCYTVEVSRDVSIRGCTQRGGCNFLTDIIKNIAQERGALDSQHSTGKIRCFECISDECNRIQLEYLEIKPTHSNFINESRGEKSFTCYHCLDGCKLVDAQKKICGQNIAKSHEAVCSVQVAQGDDPSLAIRKCQVVQKYEQLSCPENSDCGFCQSDLCNTEVPAGDASLKCHVCLDACEVSESQDMVCGRLIGDSMESICTTEVPKDSDTPSIAVRKCQIIYKGGQYQCPANYDCTTCKSDLCNSAHSTFFSMALVGIPTAIFVLLIN